MAAPRAGQGVQRVLGVLARQRREAPRDVAEGALGRRVVVEHQRRVEGARERGEGVGEGVVGGDELQAPVAVEVAQVVADVAPGAGRRVARAAEAHDLGDRAAVRAAGVAVDEDLGLAVGVEVDDLQRRVALARGGVDAAVLDAGAAGVDVQRAVEGRRAGARDVRCGSSQPNSPADQVSVA